MIEGLKTFSQILREARERAARGEPDTLGELILEADLRSALASSVNAPLTRFPVEQSKK